MVRNTKASKFEKGKDTCSMYNNIIYADETNMFLKATLLQMTN